MQVKIIQERGDRESITTSLEENKDVINARISNSLTHACTCQDCPDPSQVSVTVYRGGDPFVIPIYQITYEDGSMYNLDYGYLSAEQVKNKKLGTNDKVKISTSVAIEATPTRDVERLKELFFEKIKVVAPLKETDPTGKNPHEAGYKPDYGKPPVITGVLQHFPRAIRKIAETTEWGRKDHKWDGWKDVPNGAIRYTDALGRHLIDEIIDGPIDPRTDLLHAAQVAWNALARLELILKEKESKHEAS